MKAREIPFAATLPPQPPRPPLSALFGSPQERAAFLRFHVEDRVFGGLEMLGFHALRHFPAHWVSNFGAAMSPAPRFLNRKQPWVARMRRSIAAIRRDLEDDPAAIEAMLASWFRHVARTHAEYPVMHRLREPANITLSWDEEAHALASSGRQMVVTSCHLGTFESWLTALDERFGWCDRIFVIYEPQPNRGRNRIAAKTRTERGYACLPPGPVTQRLLPKLLRDGHQSVLFHVDENVGHTVGFPLFGRPPEKRSNLMRVIKTARIFDAPILPLLTWRTGPARARVHLHAPIMPGGLSRSEEDIDRAVTRLNRIYEPAVRRHLDQWFMLPWMDI